MKYRVVNMTDHSLVADYEPSSAGLTYLAVCTLRKRIFIADRNGSIFIFDTSQPKPRPLIHLASTLKFVRGLAVDSKRGYLMAVGYDDGEL
jgi:hypothetical protein